jgi:hypothetical protein
MQAKSTWRLDSKNLLSSRRGDVTQPSPSIAMSLNSVKPEPAILVDWVARILLVSGGSTILHTVLSK